MLKFAYGHKSHSSDVRVPSYGDLTETFPPRTVMVAMDGSEDSRFAFHCKYMNNLFQLSVFIGDTFFAYQCKRRLWCLTLKFDFLLNRWDGNLHKYIIYLINKIVLMIHAGIQKIVQGGI